MKKEGMVISNDGAYINVLIIRESGWGGKCSSCSGCSSEKKPVINKVLNEVDAKIGETVILEAEDNLIIRYTLILYLIPLIMFVIGIISGIIIFGKNNVSHSDIKSIGFGLLFLAISFIFLKIIDSKILRKNNDIIRVIKIL